MSRFNTYMASHFGSCRLLAYAHDHCRNRDVRIYLMPGIWEVVGVTDGTDAWIAPVVQGMNYFSVNIHQLVTDLHDGKPIPKPVPLAVSPGRRRAALAEEAEEPPARRRAPVEDQEPQPQPRRRRAVEV